MLEEEDNKMELIKVENNQLSITNEASEKLKELYKFKAEFDVRMDELKKELLKAMEENGIKSFENDYMKITYKAPTTRKSVDTKRLKDEGLYDIYTKESIVKSSVTVNFK